MINKEEIEKDIVEYTTQFFPSRDEMDRKLRNSRLKLIAKGILEIIEENERLEEINAEHQKLNGELQKKITEYEKQLDLDYVEENYVKKSVFLNLLKENGELKDRLIIAEEICKGKSIQELGMSDLYMED